MRDIGHEETEEVLKEIEKRISEEYAKAEREVAKTLDDYLEKFRVKDELKLKALDNGMITEAEYKQWRVGQIMMGQRWAEMRDTLAQDFTNADKIARSIAYEHMPEVYAINFDYGTFQVEKGSLIDTSYTLYDRNALEELVKNEDSFIPAPGRKVSRDIKEGKALAWNKKQVQSAMMQGLLQGESIPKLATRVADTVGESDRKAAIRNARTMTTGVQNAGRVASYDRANKMGIETRKQWLATLDNRTRHWHASLDGEVVDNDMPFENEYGEIMYPGDPSADPANIYNCRCTLIASIKGFERDVSDMNLRHDDHLEDMTYEEWREGHYEQKSDSITKQDEIAEKMQYAYGAEYRKYKNISDEDVENDLKEHAKSDILDLSQLDVQRYDNISKMATTEEIQSAFPGIVFDDTFAGVPFASQKELAQGLQYMQDTFGEDAMPRRIRASKLDAKTSARVNVRDRVINLNTNLAETDAYLTALHESIHLLDNRKGDIAESVINEALRESKIRKNSKAATKALSDTMGMLTAMKYEKDFSEQMAWSFEKAYRKDATSFATSVKAVTLRRFANGGENPN